MNENYIKNYHICQNGDIINKKTNKKLKKRLNKGYEIVDLFDGNGNKKTFQVHRLLAIQFIPNPNNLPQINHKNLIRNDNRIENLEWCDAKYNLAWFLVIKESVIVVALLATVIVAITA